MQTKKHVNEVLSEHHAKKVLLTIQERRTALAKAEYLLKQLDDLLDVELAYNDWDELMSLSSDSTIDKASYEFSIASMQRDIRSATNVVNKLLKEKKSSMRTPTFRIVQDGGVRL